MGTPQRRRWKEYRAYVLSSLTTSVLIFMGSALARQSTPSKGVEYNIEGNARPSSTSHLSVLNTALHYQSSHKAHNPHYELFPYAHPHIHIFTLLYNNQEPIARFVNLILHLPWLLLIFFCHGLGVYVLSIYYRSAHLWSSINNSQHTAEELLELIEEGKYEDDEEEDENEGLCLTLVNCGGNQEVMKEMALEVMTVETGDSATEREETPEEICSKIVEGIITSSLTKQKSIGNPEEEKVEREGSPTVNNTLRVDVHQDQEEF